MNGWETVTRFRQRKHMLESIDSASQKQIDEMFNAYARGEPKNELLLPALIP